MSQRNDTRIHAAVTAYAAQEAARLLADGRSFTARELSAIILLGLEKSIVDGVSEYFRSGYDTGEVVLDRNMRTRQPAP